MEMFANFYMERQGEYYGFHPADGLRIMISYAVNDSLAVPEFVVCGYSLQATNDGQAVATAAFSVSPSESPRYFAAGMDESIIVGYYTLQKCRSLRSPLNLPLNNQQKGA